MTFFAVATFFGLDLALHFGLLPAFPRALAFGLAFGPVRGLHLERRQDDHSRLECALSTYGADFASNAWTGNRPEARLPQADRL